mmetsp:Transcript_31319/g.51709  ORF Transcript_31319/g.51709 Transcript_31319/m.51709 type:complete len:740 (+) Transcript_31319:118-2337(+)
MSNNCEPSRKLPPHHQLQDIDFPTGKSFPLDHPKILLLKSLIAKDANEYDLAAKMSEERKYEGRTMRSKHDITTEIVNALIIPGEGNFKKKRLNGTWAIDTTYTTKKLRLRISNAFNTHNKENSRVRQAISAEVVDKRQAEAPVVTPALPPQQEKVVFADAQRRSLAILEQELEHAPQNQLDDMLAEIEKQFAEQILEEEPYNSDDDDDDATMPSVFSAFRPDHDVGSAMSGIFSLGNSLESSSVCRSFRSIMSENSNPNFDVDSLVHSRNGRTAMSSFRTTDDYSQSNQGSTGGGSVSSNKGRLASQGGSALLFDARTAGSSLTGAKPRPSQFLATYLKNGGGLPPKPATGRLRRRPPRLPTKSQQGRSTCGESIETSSVRSTLTPTNMEFSIGSWDESFQSNMDLSVASGATMQSASESQGTSPHHKKRTLHKLRSLVNLTMSAADLVFYLEQILGAEISHTEVVEKISVVLLAVRCHQMDVDVQQRACQALSMLSSESSDNQSTIASVGGIECVLDAMRTHNTSAKVQESACDAIGELASGHFPNQSIIADADGIPLVLKAMQLADGSLEHTGCQALGSLAWQHPKNQEAILKARGVSFVVHAMELHPEDVSTQRSGCFALGSLIGGLGHQAWIVNVLLTAMQLHVDDPIVQAHGCFALESLTKRRAADFAKAVGPQAIEPVLTALHRHPSNATVQSCGREVLACITLHNASLLVASKRFWSTPGSEPVSLQNNAD